MVLTVILSCRTKSGHTPGQAPWRTMGQQSTIAHQKASRWIAD